MSVLFSFTGAGSGLYRSTHFVIISTRLWRNCGKAVTASFLLWSLSRTYSFTEKTKTRFIIGIIACFTKV